MPKYKRAIYSLACLAVKTLVPKVTQTPKMLPFMLAGASQYQSHEFGIQKSGAPMLKFP